MSELRTKMRSWAEQILDIVGRQQIRGIWPLQVKRISFQSFRSFE